MMPCKQTLGESLGGAWAGGLAWPSVGPGSKTTEATLTERSGWPLVVVWCTCPSLGDMVLLSPSTLSSLVCCVELCRDSDRQAAQRCQSPARPPNLTSAPLTLSSHIRHRLVCAQTSTLVI